jgi:hypothetical protein
VPNRIGQPGVGSHQRRLVRPAIDKDVCGPVRSPSFCFQPFLERLKPSAKRFAPVEPLGILTPVRMEDDGDVFERLVVVACFEAEGCPVAFVEPDHEAHVNIGSVTKKVRRLLQREPARIVPSLFHTDCSRDSVPAQMADPPFRSHDFGTAVIMQHWHDQRSRQHQAAIQSTLHTGGEFLHISDSVKAELTQDLPVIAIGVSLIETGERVPEGRWVLAVTPAWERILEELGRDPDVFHKLRARCKIN